MSFLYKADPARGAVWAELFAERAPDLPFRVWPDVGDPAQVKYLAAWQPPEDLAGLLPNLEVLFSVGAGIDQFDLSHVPGHVPVVRRIEPGIPPTPWTAKTSSESSILGRNLISWIIG